MGKLVLYRNRRNVVKIHSLKKITKKKKGKTVHLVQREKAIPEPGQLHKRAREKESSTG